MGWNYPNPIYMYPRRKKRNQCNKCKYKLGNLCYQSKYQDYNYAELEGTTKRNCKYFKEKQKNPPLRRKEIEKLRPSFEEIKKIKSPKKGKMKKQNNKLNAVVYTILALALFIYGFLSDYPDNLYILIGAIIVGVCAFY